MTEKVTYKFLVNGKWPPMGKKINAQLQRDWGFEVYSENGGVVSFDADADKPISLYGLRVIAQAIRATFEEMDWKDIEVSLILDPVELPEDKTHGEIFKEETE